MATSRDDLARAGEEAAARFLAETAGMQVLERNYRCRAGELDVVAQHGDTLVFVEVKTRSSAAFGAPAEAVSASKQARIRRAAAWFLAERRLPDPACRFDVVALTGRPGAFQIEHLPDAF